MEEAASKAALRFLQPSPERLGLASEEMRMAFLDFLTGKIKCPRCGTRGAKEINGQICCPNPTCAYFSKTMGKGDPAPVRDSVTFSQYGEEPTRSVFGQPIEVPAGSFAIHYRDFRGRERTFVAQAASARRQKNHISAKVEPEGRRISLARDRILNLNEVEAAFPQRVAPRQDWPTPLERQVLNYHKKHHSTSPRYESIRAKYPNW
jgi:hypothetical protein